MASSRATSQGSETFPQDCRWRTVGTDGSAGNGIRTLDSSLGWGARGRDPSWDYRPGGCAAADRHPCTCRQSPWPARDCDGRPELTPGRRSHRSSIDSDNPKMNIIPLRLNEQYVCRTQNISILKQIEAKPGKMPAFLLHVGNPLPPPPPPPASSRGSILKRSH